jgi:hypothetical protein
MHSNTRGTLRRGAASSAAVLIAGASMWLTTAPTLAKGHDADKAPASNQAQAHHDSTASSSGQSNHTSSGDSNRGDVWTDNVGQPSGPGHEQDPHLACVDINLWGDKMGDATDSYTIDSWPPSGNKSLAYSSTWHYNQAQAGAQVIDVVNVRTLVANAQAAGAAPVNKNGYHFKLQLTQDPQKHKTFWVSCPAPTPTPTPTPTSGGTGGTGQGAGGTEGTSTGSTPGTVETVTPPASGVQGASTVVPSAAAPAKAAAAAQSPVQAVLGAATSMPTTGRAFVGLGLLAALGLVLGGALMVRRARTA